MITIDNVSFWYSKRKTVFSDLNFSMDSGHIYGLLGKNGSGKTTLLKLFTGLVFPKSGKITVDSSVPWERKPSFLSDVFFVPEEISLPSYRIRKYIDLYGPFYPDFSIEQVMEYIERFEIPANVKIGELSHGQKKKFLIAFALATNVSYLFLDEPANGLDIPSKAAFRSMLAGLYAEERTIIISTHMIRDLESMIDRVIIVDEGNVMMNNDIEPGSGNVSFTGESDIENLFNRIINQKPLKEYSNER